MSCQTLEDLCLNAVRRNVQRISVEFWPCIPGKLKEQLIERLFWHRTGYDVIFGHLLSSDVRSLRLDETLSAVDRRNVEECFLNESFFRRVAETCPQLQELCVNSCGASVLQCSDLLAVQKDLVHLSLVLDSSLDLEGCLSAALVRLASTSLAKFSVKVGATVRAIASISRLQNAFACVIKRNINALQALALHEFELTVPQFFQDLPRLENVHTLELVNWHAMLVGHVSQVPENSTTVASVNFSPVVDFSEFLPILAGVCPNLANLVLKCRCFMLHKQDVDFSAFKSLKQLELRGHSFSGCYKWPDSLRCLNLTYTMVQPVMEFVNSFENVVFDSFVFHPTSDGNRLPIGPGLNSHVFAENILTEILPQIGHLVTVLYLNKCTKRILRSVADHCKNLQGLTCAFPDFETFPSDLAPIVANSGPKLRSFIAYWGQFVNMAALNEERENVSQLQELILQTLRCCPNLEAFNMSDLDFVDDHFLALLAFSCKHLRYLDLTGCNNVTDEGVKFLASGCPHLTVLQLQKTKITDDSLRLIGQNLIHLDSIGISVRELIEAEAREMAAEILNTTHRVHSLVDQSYLIDRAVRRGLTGINCTLSAWQSLRDQFVRPPKFSKYDFVHTYTGNNVFQEVDLDLLANEHDN